MMTLNLCINSHVGFADYYLCNLVNTKPKFNLIQQMLTDIQILTQRELLWKLHPLLLHLCPIQDKLFCYCFCGYFQNTVIFFVLNMFQIILFSLDEKDTIEGSGTIVESSDGRNIVLTSANIIRRPTKKEFVDNYLIDDLKVNVL